MQVLFLHVEVVTLQFLSLKELRELPALALAQLGPTRVALKELRELPALALVALV